MTVSAYETYLLRISEDDLQKTVLDLCRLLHVRVAHFRPARTDRGWRTPVAGDGAGFPDLVLVGPSGVLWRELKTQKGTISSDQLDWLADLQRAGADAGIWRPSDLVGTVRRELEAIAKPADKSTVKPANQTAAVKSPLTAVTQLLDEIRLYAHAMLDVGEYRTAARDVGHQLLTILGELNDPAAAAAPGAAPESDRGGVR